MSLTAPGPQDDGTDGGASDVRGRVAFATAISQACHQVADDPRIFDDPLAARVVGMSDVTLSGLATPEPVHRRGRLYLAARSRFADDSIAEAVAAGTRQVVVLGAGLDTFGSRNPWPEVRVFEVDHAGAQAWKRQRLADAGIAAPASLRYVPTDFDTLAEDLAGCGFDRSVGSVFVWFGQIPFLPMPIVLATMRFVAACPRAQLVGEYIEPMDGGGALAAIGFPPRTVFTPAEIADESRGMGFDEVDDIDGIALVSRYCDESFPPPSLFGSHILRAGHRATRDRPSRLWDLRLLCGWCG